MPRKNAWVAMGFKYIIKRVKALNEIIYNFPTDINKLITFSSHHNY